MLQALPKGRSGLPEGEQVPGEKVFLAEVEDCILTLMATGSRSSSSSSSSSDEEIIVNKGGKDTGGPAGLCFMA